MNWILFHPSELDATGHAILSGERATHIRKILRAESGKTLRIGLMNGPLGTGTVETVDAETVGLSCEFESAPPPRPRVDLLLAMPRPKVLKRLWSQFAALGVGRILLMNAEKVERYYFDTHVITPEFYTARLIEGLQQAGDTWLPEVTVVKHGRSFLEKDFDSVFPSTGIRLLADPSGEKNMFQCLGPHQATVGKDPQRILLGVGPEGGWTPAEVALFEAQGFDLFGLGSRILRTDTACITLLGLLNEISRTSACRSSRIGL